MSSIGRIASANLIGGLSSVVKVLLVDSPVLGCPPDHRELVFEDVFKVEDWHERAKNVHCLGLSNCIEHVGEQIDSDLRPWIDQLHQKLRIARLRTMEVRD